MHPCRVILHLLHQISDRDSLYSISDFEVEYYVNWQRCYCELLNQIETTHILHPAPPIPKCLQLHLLDY